MVIVVRSIGVIIIRNELDEESSNPRCNSLPFPSC